MGWANTKKTYQLYTKLTQLVRFKFLSIQLHFKQTLDFFYSYDAFKKPV